jgi:hypothetical protein
VFERECVYIFIFFCFFCCLVGYWKRGVVFLFSNEIGFCFFDSAGICFVFCAILEFS